jgi:hypothetical protein
MDDAGNMIKIYQANLYEKRPAGRPKAGWKGDVENGVRKVVIVDWKQRTQD